ncbi:hypothetical protein GCM10028803_23770 [Larkinella knui]
MTKSIVEKLKKTAWYLGVPAVNFALSTITLPVLSIFKIHPPGVYGCVLSTSAGLYKRKHVTAPAFNLQTV